MGSHLIKSWSVTQDVLALSSGEAEYYAMVKCGAQSLGLKEMFAEWGLDAGTRIHIKTDAAAAMGISQRRGLGKVRHIEVNQLWLQDMVAKGRMIIEKVDGKKNIADALTKDAARDMLSLHIEGVGLEFRRDRHELNPSL